MANNARVISRITNEYERGCRTIEDKKISGNNPTILRFGLLIDKVISLDGKDLNINIKTNNQGIPTAEVILIVEAWVDKMKEVMQQPIKDSLTFIDPNKDK